MKKIIHIDMDAFFASVEQRDNPDLRGKPIAVGGKANSRGVVATASYEARQYGVRSAMPMATATRLCPQLIVVPTRHQHYREISQQIREIFARFTDKIEPLSIDEAYLDVSHNNDFNGSATLLAQCILDTIYAETQLTASAGVSYCKFLAKYASNINKPNGIFTVTPKQAQAIIDKMPVEKFHGIGPATQKRLNTMNIFTGADLRQANRQQLRETLGKVADFYYNLANARDDREVKTDRKRKSIGNETTFHQDINDIDELWEKLQTILHKTWDTLNQQDLSAMTITVKIKYHDFSLHTKSHTEKYPIDRLPTAEMICQSLLRQANHNKPVRLIGVTFSQLRKKQAMPIQLRLFD